MSHQGLHVHGPHDHALEHATASGHSDPMTNQIALFTAIIATVGALFGYMDGTTLSNAIIYKNNAAISKTEASNQWNYYQAKSNKQNISELAVELIPNSKTKDFGSEIERYKNEKKELKIEAEKFEAESKNWDKQSDFQMHMHHRWAQGTTLLQVSIALAAISLLTKNQWLKKLMYAVGTVGVLVGILAAMHI